MQGNCIGSWRVSARFERPSVARGAERRFHPYLQTKGKSRPELIPDISATPKEKAHRDCDSHKWARFQDNQLKG
jgi:hypothetical protein